MPLVRELFDSPIVYVIPDYQRIYVWNKFDQWEPLWQDVTTIASSLLDQDEPSDLEPHFLGATVLKEGSSGVDQARQYTLVDGQQRLTTLQLLLTAVGDSIRETSPGSNLETSARGLTINYSGGTPSADEPDKIKPLAGDFTALSDVMDASRRGIMPTVDDRPILKCYEYFRAESDKWLICDGAAQSNVERRARALLTAISDKMQVVAIHLHRRENESAIFEALNARGEPLSEWEKVKNYILFKAGDAEGIDQAKLYRDYLLPFDERQWAQESGSGAARRRISDVFLDYWLESRTGNAVNTRRVYRDFRSMVKNHEASLKLDSLCKELMDDGNFFLRWNTSSNWDGNVENVFHGRRRALDIGGIWPILLALHRIAKGEDFRRCLRAIDSYLYRRAIVGLSTRGYDSLTLELVKALPEDPQGPRPFSDAIIQRLSEYKSNNTRYWWPDDARVKREVLNRKIKRSVARQVLEGIERGMIRGRRPGNRNLSSGLPIEHLLPQRWNTETWPLPRGAGDDANDIRNDALHRLGNLTLVDHGLNSKLSNRSWTQKRKILETEDNLYINKDLLNNAPKNRWDEKQIQRRGERLANYIVEIWPHGEQVTGEIERLK